jgi:hypothetical protein
MPGMTTIQRVYFFSAWVVAGCALLAAILLGVDRGGLLGFGLALEVIFLGFAGCFTLLYMSEFFTNSLVLLNMSIVVGVIALLALIMQSSAYGNECTGKGMFKICTSESGTFIAGTIFRILFEGVFATILLLRISGKISEK